MGAASVTPTSEGRPCGVADVATDGGARWLDEDEQAAWLGLVRVVSRLPATLDARLERTAGLTLFGYTLLAMLSEQPDGALRMSRLAAATDASPSRVSHAARQLESRGLLVRRPDPDDGRCIRAVLTADGRALVVATAPGHVADVRSLVVDALGRDELAALRSATERILARIDPEGVTDPTRAPDPGPDRKDES
jgi:DNA-binding MarR family transcriptional regulator